jgi:hypothetical protein
MTHIDTDNEELQSKTYLPSIFRGECTSVSENSVEGTITYSKQELSAFVEAKVAEAHKHSFNAGWYAGARACAPMAPNREALIEKTKASTDAEREQIDRAVSGNKEKQ